MVALARLKGFGGAGRAAQRGPAAQRLFRQALLIVGHGGTAGLIVEISTAVAIGVLLLWAAIKSRGEGH